MTEERYPIYCPMRYKMASPTMNSIVNQLVRRIPKKTIFIIVIFGPIIHILFVSYYLNENNHTPSTMCSSRYPGYSKILDMPVTLPDGRIQADGWIYPPDAVWRESDIVRGCPCSAGPCIRSCSPKGKYIAFAMKGITILGYSKTEQLDRIQPLFVSSDSDPFDMVKVSAKHFSILENSCLGVLEEAESSSLTNNGNVWVNGTLFAAGNYDHCFNVLEDSLLWNTVFKCSQIIDSFTKPSLIRLTMTIIIINATVTTLVLMTLILYVLVPSLRQQTYGKSLINYSITLFISKVLESVNMYGGAYSKGYIKYTDVLSQSTVITLILWQGTIVWEMRALFEPGKLRAPKREEGNSKIIIYSLLIWSIFGVNAMLKSYLSVSRNKQYLELVIVLVNLYLNFSALLRLRSCLKDSKKTQGPESQRHNLKECRWMSVFLKFSFVSNLDYTIIAIARNFYALSYGTEYTSHSTFRYILVLDMYINCLRGSELFFLNVWKKGTLTMIKKRIFSR